MGCSAVKNYVNPFSKGFIQAKNDFKDLKIGQKILTVALSAIAGLASCFLLGIGGFATFKALVDAFKVEKKEGVHATTQNVAQTVLPVRPNPTSLPLEELLQKTSGMRLENNRPRLTDGDVVSHEQQEINSAIFEKVRFMQPSEQQQLLVQLKDQPEKAALIAHGMAIRRNNIIANTCEFLEECEWPSQEFKDNILPTIISNAVKLHGIAWDNWDSGFVQTGPRPKEDLLNVPGFCCQRLLINTKKIFGCGDFTVNPKPISPLLAKSIGEAIKSVAAAHISDLKGKIESGQDMKNIRVGVEVVIGQFVETRFPASMIVPLLPYLKDVPGLVSLELSDVGVRNPQDLVTGKDSNGFCDEHADALLEIFRSQPYLMQTKLNIEGMSEGKIDDFMMEWHQIWKDRAFQRPLTSELLALTEKS